MKHCSNTTCIIIFHLLYWSINCIFTNSLNYIFILNEVPICIKWIKYYFFYEDGRLSIRLMDQLNTPEVKLQYFPVVSLLDSPCRPDQLHRTLCLQEWARCGAAETQTAWLQRSPENTWQQKTRRNLVSCLCRAGENSSFCLCFCSITSCSAPFAADLVAK